jgi:excisionase family DNA binding protein
VNRHQPWYNLKDGASYANVSPATMRREIKLGRLRHARVCGRKSIRLRPEWIDEWLEGTVASAKVSK